MASDAERVRDMRFGRRGGNWIDDPDARTTTGPPCDVCRQPMVAGQRGRHLECCAERGGRQPVCNPIRTDTKLATARTVCARCWIDAVMPAAS